MPYFLPAPIASLIQSWLCDYNRLQSLAVLLLYVQIGCSMAGSLGALYSGVLLVDLVVSLFALVAIESSSQSLGRTYAALLSCAILLDVAWFILFSHTIWNTNSEKNDAFFVFSLKVTLWMQIIGFSVRFLSSVLWIQMYRLGPSSFDNSIYREADYGLQNSFLSPTRNEANRQTSNSDEILGGSIYNPAYYSSLFEESPEKLSHNEGERRYCGLNASTSSSSEVSQLKACVGQSFLVSADDGSRGKLQSC